MGAHICEMDRLTASTSLVEPEIEDFLAIMVE